ncbi:MAG TPA: type II toxin-antitoxin system prevent-host-death family antitoxin [Burkholderiaceae bacterium]|nr:type II toxin-antitoxin system prevent-host-death family antitoxin [Burkholderiaceae bacterium]
MVEIGAFAAKTQFSKLLERIRDGEVFTITHRGQPVAVLGPLPEHRDPEQAKVVLARLREGARHQSKVPISTEELLAWRGEGRR